MRIAVLSDIHSNLAALEAVREDLARLDLVDETWVLGDIVGYGPEPNEVVRELQAMGARSVLGNHDGAAIGTVDAAYFNPEARTAIEWTAQAVDPNARAYLSTLPEVRREGQLTAVHGSPRDPIWEYIVSSSVAAENLAHFETRVCLFGHTHLPVIFCAHGNGIEIVAATPEAPQRIDAGRALVNPGSVGQPRDGDPASSYLVLDTESDAVEFRRVRYDIERTQRNMIRAGLPARLAERLSYGR
jgi:predicted phosphodiesterase